MPEVYTLDDLVSREVLDGGAAQPARLAVLGWPVAHSASPQMHQAALAANGIAARYIRLAVPPGQLPAAFARLRDLDFIGCNVTVPHKLAALTNCTEVHPAARVLGAVNTVRFDAAATCGFNTDGPGFAKAIEADFGMPLAGLKVAIIGAGGGAGQAIAIQCLLLGVKQLVVVNRTVAKLDPLVAHLQSLTTTTEIIPLALADAALADHCQACDLIVNASSVGLQAGDPAVLPAACLRPGQCVYDTIYQPPATPLLTLAASCGCRTSNGLSMLLQQGALAFQQWFPQTEPLAVMRLALVPPV